MKTLLAVAAGIALSTCAKILVAAIVVSLHLAISLYILTRIFDVSVNRDTTVAMAVVFAFLFKWQLGDVVRAWEKHVGQEKEKS